MIIFFLFHSFLSIFVETIKWPYKTQITEIYRENIDGTLFVGEKYYEPGFLRFYTGTACYSYSKNYILKRMLFDKSWRDVNKSFSMNIKKNENDFQINIIVYPDELEINQKFKLFFLSLGI
jgi:hypothetical protein